MKNKDHISVINCNSSISKNGKSINLSLKWFLIIAQCLGQMPVIGISKSNPDSLCFTMKSWRFVYSILYCLCAALMNIFLLHLMIEDGMDLNHLTGFIFHFNTFIISILFLKLASEWSKIMKKWIYVEYCMRNYGYPKQLQRRINVITTIILSLGLMEHLSLRINNIISTIKCRGSIEFFEFYFTRSLYPDIFELLGYNIWLAILLQIVNFLLTFAWTFNDLFIMLIGTALAARFSQVTGRLRMLKGKFKMNPRIQVWREIREDYNRLCNLTGDINDSLSNIIIMSFANNLYFVIIQIFNSMRKLETPMEKVYFYLSFGFLILRFAWVCVCGSWIYEESRKPISILCTVPSRLYNIEILRLIEQVKYSTMALTGKNFFYISRGLILRMAGAIVTYELVLIQYNGNDLLINTEERNETVTYC